MTRGDAEARRAWDGLDQPGRLALTMAWEAARTGNIGVGAVVTDPSGTVVVSGRNRVLETTAPPPGEIAGSSLAHAEMNVLARLVFRSPRELTLTTSLQPCLQCSAAIRMAPIADVRVLGADPLWDGCHDFTSLTPWVARRPAVPTDGPRTDEVGRFATLIARLGPGFVSGLDEPLRQCGEGPLLDLVHDLQRGDDLPSLLALGVDEAFAALWPHLVEVTRAMAPSAGSRTSAAGPGAPTPP